MQPQLESNLVDIIINLGDRLNKVEQALTNDAVPVGALMEWPALSTLLPFNYLPADGRAIDRVAYSSLYSQIGTTHGVGDGSTSFNIPDRSCQIYMDASTTRTGCVPLDGTSYLRTTYPDLFTALGGASSPWGLPDGTHFNVPDMRGRTAIGAGVGTGLSNRVLGVQNIGEENHALTVAELAVHSHGIDVRNDGVGTSAGNVSVQGNGNAANWGGIGGINNTGSGNAHNTMQPSGVYNFFISTTNSTVIKVL